MSARSEATTAANEAAEAAVQAQLERMLASKTFRQVDRLKRFLSFIVSETVDGRGDELKEYVIGVQVFGKEPSFDPRTDPIVRVQARRLRARLVRYYREEGKADELIIDLPKGGYAPVFKHARGRAAKRSISATLAEPQHRRGAAVRRSQRRRQPRLLLPRRCATKSSTRWPRSSRCACSRGIRRSRAGDDPRAGRDALHAAMIITGSVRAGGRRAPRHDASRRRRERLLPVVRIDGRRRPRDLRGAGDDRAGDRRKLAAGGRRGGRARGPPAGRQPRRAQSVSAGPLSPESAHRRRTAEGGRVLREGDRRGRAVRARAQRARRRATACCAHYGVLGPADVWTKAASSAASAVMLDATPPRRTRRWRT